MKKYILPILSIIFLGTSLFAHSNKVKIPIIIDTDTAVDDLRTICLLLSSEELQVTAITTSDGALIPDEGLIKVRALLKSFGHEGIPTGSGKIVQLDAPQWRKLSQNISWGDEHLVNTDIKMNAPDLIISSIYTEELPVTIVCLGSLTNISNALISEPEIKKGIERIVWYNNSIHPNVGTNYEIDKNAAEFIQKTEVQLDVVSNLEGKEICFTENLLQAIDTIETPYAQKIAISHRQNEAYEMIQTNHFKLWDDLVAIYLLYPELFETKTFENFPLHSINNIIQTDNLEDKIVKVLNDKYNIKKIIFNQFPYNPEAYKNDISQDVSEIIEKHGKEEWEIIVLTNEFHTHLGIYSTIGAKMGLRAREYFNVGLDELLVVSYAGTRPPISCLNDGLQVSTGATLGHGTIVTMTEDLLQQPKALFTYKNTTISLELKQDYWEIIREDIREGIKLYGSLTNNYWNYVRKLAIKYWLEWSRKEIFNIEVLQ